MDLHKVCLRASKFARPPPNHRTIFCNDRAANRIFHFKGNSVSTTKYNVLTFLPKGLFEQFRRVANLYFLVIAILSSIPISPVSLASNMTPLMVVILFSLLKEAFEDWKRFKTDLSINNRLVDILQGQKWESISWEKLQVGDIVRIKQDGLFPADLLFLASTNLDGLCYVETSNLDGETNLKIKKAAEMSHDYLDPEIAFQFKGEVECELPNNSLYTYNGNLILHQQKIPVDANQLLLRECRLRNTEYIVGVAIYTGHETKIMTNTMNPRSKRSTLERKLDKLIIVLLVVLLVMCIIGGLCSRTFIHYKYYYLGLQGVVDDNQFDPQKRFQGFILTMFTFITLFSTIIPVSLYVTLEIIKFSQSSQYINKDLRMYDPETQTPAQARTSNINEDLGQVDFIFTDKTGTLTRNSMEFFKCSIGGEVYGTGITEIETIIAERNGTKLRDVDEQSNIAQEKGFHFHDTRIMNGAWRNQPNPDIYKEFFRCLAICHTVLPDGDESPERIKYLAASPDEAALVTAAKVFGFFLYRRKSNTSICYTVGYDDGTRRTPTMIYVRESNVERMGEILDVTYEILNVLEFNSTRMRQSVICRYPDGRLVLYCKGADSVIFERLAEKGNDVEKKTRQHLEQFGSSGLRTLCMAYRDLNPEEYINWNEKFVSARASLGNRMQQLHEVAELIERGLFLIGCTAIEDRLQEGVPFCIETLSMAGIKVCMVTGDRMDAALNVAYACNLMNDTMKQCFIISETDEIRQVEERGDQLEIARTMKDVVKQQLKSFYEQAELYRNTTDGPKLALVIDGKSLTYAIDPAMRLVLLKLIRCCSSLVCFRVLPLEKAKLVRWATIAGKWTTLAIGDGANDVGMIQAAHVGVGISGLEGMQAVMASDFAIAQFQYLTDLLLVHGRLSYIRISKVVTYFFYKNLVFTLTQMWFTFQAGWSGQRFYDDVFQGCYNLVFTSLPVLALGIFEKDLDSSICKKFPKLYKEGQTNTHFKWRSVVIWALSGVYQSLVIFYFVTQSGISPQTSSGKMLGLWDISTMSFTCVVITVNLRLLLCCNNVTRWHHICVWGSILAWFLFICIYSGVMTKNDRQENVYRVIYVLMSTPYFYLSIILVPTVALIGDFLFHGTQRYFFPNDSQIIQEQFQDVPPEHRRMDLQIENPLTPEEMRSYAISQLPTGKSKHTGFAFDSPGYESFFAASAGVYAPSAYK